MRSSAWLLPGAFLLALGSAGCAAIPWPHAPRAPHGERGAEGWLDLRGAVHVHTRGSHDSPGTIAEVVAAARSAGLAWVAITEHTRPGVLGAHGVIDGVNVLPGFEASTAGGSLLALGVAEKPPTTKDPAALVRFVREAGGVAVVGHFERSRLAEPEAWRAAAPDAVELVNLHANAERARGSLAWRAPLLPSAWALRALLELPERNLLNWEALPGPPPIVGAVDAHARFRLLGPLGGTPDRYRDVFRLLTTHVLARDASAPAISAPCARGAATSPSRGARPWTASASSRSRAASCSRRRARRGSRWCATARAPPRPGRRRAVLAPPAGARRCRAEAWLGDRPWILTSYRDAVPIREP